MEPAPSDSFTPRRAQKGYSELNVNHIFTGMNQITVSLSHNTEFNHAAALRVLLSGRCAWAGRRPAHSPSDGVGGCGCPWSLGKGNGHSGRPDAGVSSPLVPQSRLPFNITSVRGGHHRLVSTLHAVAI